jgi:hypothetical protein
MPFDDTRVYPDHELQLDALPDDHRKALGAIADAQRVAGEPAWEKVDGVRQLTAGGVVFIPDEKDVPSPGATTGSVGCLMFFLAGGLAVQLAFGGASQGSFALLALATAVSIVGLGLMLRGVRASKSPAKFVLGTGAYLFPKVLVFVGTLGVNAFPKERILSFYTAIFTEGIERTYVLYRASGGEEAHRILASAEWCPRLERWRTEEAPTPAPEEPAPTSA